MLLETRIEERVKEKIDREPKGYCFGSTFMNAELSAWEYIESVYENLQQDESVLFSKKHTMSLFIIS